VADTEARRTTAGGHHGPCLTCKQHPSSDHTRKDPSEDRNGHCRRTGGIITKKGDKRSNHEYQLMHKLASTNNNSIGLCALWTSRKRSISAFDKLWVTMMDMGYSLHLIDLLAKLYRK